MTTIGNRERKTDRVDSCEAVVVGAGLVGAAVAANLAAEGIDVAALEAREVAGGAVGRTPGLVHTGLPTPYAQVVQERGRETAQALWGLSAENRASLTSGAVRMGVALEHSGSLMLAAGREEATLLEASAEMLSADGFEVRFENRDPLDRGFVAALHYPEDVVIDTAALTGSLLETNGVPVHTGTEVYGLDQDGDEVLILARGRMVRASTVVLTVNAYAALIDGYFSDKVAPVRSPALSTRPMEKGVIPTPGSAGPFSFLQTDEGRLLFNAWPAQYETPATGPDDKGAEIDLLRFVGRHFPEATSRLAWRGSSVVGSSRDGLPLIGALPHLPQVFFAVGLAGCGLSLAFAAADLLSGLIVRGAEPALLSARRLE